MQKLELENVTLAHDVINPSVCDVTYFCFMSGQSENCRGSLSCSSAARKQNNSDVNAS